MSAQTCFRMRPHRSVRPRRAARHTQLQDHTGFFHKPCVVADVLSDATARALYDELGPERMRARAGAAAGAGTARAAGDEFKPFKRESKRTRARVAGAAAADGDGGRVGNEPAFGDVVEYPLRAVEIEDLCDGRTAGVGLLARLEGRQ